MRNSRLLIVIVALLALVATACSGASGTESVADTVPPEGTDTGTTTAPGDDGQDRGDDDPADDEAGSESAPPDDAPPVGAVAGGTLRVGLPVVGPVDPAEVSLGSRSEMIVADLLFDGLTQWDAERGELVPALAATWESDPDATIWTFTLDSDAAFADGTPVTADDVKASLERLVSADVVAVGATRLEIVAGFEDFVDGAADGIEGLVATDESTLVIELSGPMAALPWILSSPVYGVVGAQGPGGAGSGPFVIAAESEGAMRLEPAPGAEVWVDAIELVEVDVDDTLAAVRDGDTELDVVVVGHDAAQELAAVHAPALTLVSTGFHVHVYLGLGAGSDTLSDPDLRAAVIAAVDTAAVTDEVYGPTAQAIAGLVPGSDVCNGLCGNTPDVVEAFVDGLDGDVPEITIDYIDDDEVPDDPVIARLVADQLVAAGFPVRLRSWDADDYVDALAAGELEVFWFGWVGVGETPESWVGHYASGDLDNLVGIENGAVDIALAAARVSTDPIDAAEAYALAEEAVMASNRVLPLAEFVTLVAVADDVEGLTVRSDGTFDVTSLWLSPPPGE